MDIRLSQRELARQLGVRRSSIENWERNQVAPVRWLVPRISKLLGLRPCRPPASFAERLTTYRRGLGLSQEAISNMLGVHKTTVVRWETGSRCPSKAHLETIETLWTEFPGGPGASPAAGRRSEN